MADEMVDVGMIDLAREAPKPFPLYDMMLPHEPYCCEFTLHEEELEKLGLDASCEHGDEIRMTVHCVVAEALSSPNCSYVKLRIMRCKVDGGGEPEKKE